MSYYNTGFNLNKKKNGNSGKRTKLKANMVTLTLISLLLISVPVTLFSSTVYAVEPSLESLLNEFGFTNIAPSDIETFPSGIYEAKLLAEFGNYHAITVLSYYAVATTDYQTIFTGPEGATGPLGGYVVPPVSKTFVVDKQFGLSIFVPFRYFTEHSLNPDYPILHTKIYVNLDAPTMFLIAFEDSIGGFDKDYNDMLFSIEQIFPPEIVSVNRAPQNPIYNQSVTVTAQVTSGSNAIESVILSHQVDTSIWTNVTMNLGSSGYRAVIPALPYNRQVNYKVYASDTNGYSDVSTIYSYTTIIPDRSPIAVLTASPSIVDTEDVVDFNASASYDPDGTIVSYYWDFGDGTTDSEVTARHSYVEDGIYTVTLRVVDNEELIGSSVAAIRVKNRAPVAVLTEVASIINEKEEVSFDASESYDPDGTIASYIWGFGDGTAVAGITVTHSYDDTGFYNVTLTVMDNDRAADSVMHSIQVINSDNSLPVASFTMTKETANINENLSFDGTESYDSDGTIVSYSWDFGDGTATTGAKVDHKYTDGGVFTVKLTITDNEGAVDDVTGLVTITNVMNSPPVALFTENPTTVIPDEAIYFDASDSYDPDGTIASYTWDFGDANTATGVTVEHTYSEVGTYTITLTVTDNHGVSSSVVAETTVEMENSVSSAIISGIGIGITALIAALLYVFFKKRNKKEQSKES